VVGFGAGEENPHGVRAVTKGQRCAVALWFTLDPKHEEKVTYLLVNPSGVKYSLCFYHAINCFVI
jgi:leucine proline-enriched proteoglycan (leprecan)